MPMMHRLKDNEMYKEDIAQNANVSDSSDPLISRGGVQLPWV